LSRAGGAGSPARRAPHRPVRIPLAPQAAQRFTGGMEMLTEDQRYAAICARDARFDGVFFTCVRSTGIFCLPSCPSRTPRRDRVELAPSAAAAVERGYRACKRCGPLAPPRAAPAAAAGSLSTRARAQRARAPLTLTPGAPAEISADSGFGTERQRPETLSRIYGRPPSAIRGSAPAAPRPSTTDVAVVDAALAVRRPFHGEGLARW